MFPINNENNPYVVAQKDNAVASNKNIKQETEPKESKNLQNNKFDAEAVSVQISTQRVLTYLNTNNEQTAKTNFNAQSILDDLIKGNSEFLKFFDGGKTQEGFSLESIGYKGKAISKLNPEEAKDLVSEKGFFGIKNTSDRVAGFAINLSGNNIEALKESRKGIVQGFEEANKLFGGKLPEISYKTQERTLELIDKKIAELSGENNN